MCDYDGLRNMAEREKKTQSKQRREDRSRRERERTDEEGTERMLMRHTENNHSA